MWELEASTERETLAEVSGCTRVGTMERPDLATEKARFILMSRRELKPPLSILQSAEQDSLQHP